MLQGKTLPEWAAEIARQSEAKQDYKAPVSALAVATLEAAPPQLQISGHGTFGINHIAHRQLGEYLGLRADYYDRLRSGAADLRYAGDNTSLYDITVNTLLRTHGADKRMIRTLDGNARAVLSEGYRPIDNDEIAELVLPTIFDIPGIDWQASSLEVTESRMYMKLVNARMTAEVKVGDVVQAGVMVTNSEVRWGQSSFAVTPLVYRLICKNGAVVNDLAQRKFHTGGRGAGEGGEGFTYLRDETVQARNRATILEMRDLIRGALTDVLFHKIVDRLRESTEAKITGDPAQTVEVVAKTLDLKDGERGSVLRHLIEGADLSLYGVMQAITRTAQDTTDFDRSTDLEELGARLLTLPKAQITDILRAQGPASSN